MTNCFFKHKLYITWPLKWLMRFRNVCILIRSSKTMSCEIFSANGKENHTKLIRASMTGLHLNDTMPVDLCVSIRTSDGALSQGSKAGIRVAQPKANTVPAFRIWRGELATRATAVKEGKMDVGQDIWGQKNLNTEPSHPDIQNMNTGGQGEASRNG